VLLRDLKATGQQLKFPMGHLDSPCTMFCLFEPLRGRTAAEWCARRLHSKILPRLAGLESGDHKKLPDVLRLAFEQLDKDLCAEQDPGFTGCSAAVGLVVGQYLAVASVGRFKVLLDSGTRRQLLSPHLPGDPKERDFVLAAGGTVDSVKGRAVVRRKEHDEGGEVLDDEAFLRRVLGAADPFGALAVKGEVSRETLRSQYRRRSLLCHPDKVPAEFRDLAEQAFVALDAALQRIERLLEATSAQLVTDLCAVLTKPAAIIFAGVEAANLAKVGNELIDRLKVLTPMDPDMVILARAKIEGAIALGCSDFPTNLEPVPVTRGLGLRDLKAHGVVRGSPSTDLVALQPGDHTLLIAAEQQEELMSCVQELRGFPRAACLRAATKLGNPTCVAAFIGVQRAEKEPRPKKARVEKPARVKIRQIMVRYVTDPSKKIVDPVRRKPVERTKHEAELMLMDALLHLKKVPGDFPILAKKLSECESALKGGASCGDLGWVTRNSGMLPALESVVLGLEVGCISDIVFVDGAVFLIERVA